MKKLFVLICLSLCSNFYFVSAQERATDNNELSAMRLPQKELDASKTGEDNGKNVFVSVKEMPQFPGDFCGLMKFFSANLRYPKHAAENGIQGQVIARIVVKKDGSIGDIEIVRSLDPECDKEAVRLIKRMPKWIPGRHNGENVDVYFTVPVRFRLN